MSALAVIGADPATSVQDGGRHGAQRFGLPPSGAMDPAALALANMIVGNAREAAAVEVGPFGAVLVARGGPVRVALAGAQRPATLAGVSITACRTFVIGPDETLTLGAAREGVFSYLAIEGGIHGTPVFGSLSVNARAGLGSPYPRNLQAGDSLSVDDIRALRAERGCPAPRRDDSPIRLVRGPQFDEFEPDARAALFTQPWMVSAASDRMGYRLEGPALRHRNSHNIVSDGTTTGSIQVPGSGQPIVLMPDRGTTGGYPKIATVISVDIGRLAQVRPGQRIRFAEIDVEAAQALLRHQATELVAWPGRITEFGGAALDLDSLRLANLAGDAVSAIDTCTWQSPPIEAAAAATAADKRETQ